MKKEDFAFMRRGQFIKPLSDHQIDLLEPINIRGIGHDRALLLLHGFSSSPAVFRVMLPELTGYDAIVCPVLPGHGDSLINFSKVHSADWITEVETVCSQLVNEYKRVDVLGLSLGGLLACHLSQRFNLNRLYLLAPALVLKLNLPLTLFFAHLTYCCGLRVLPNPSAGNIHANQYAELTYRKLSVIMSIRILTFIRDFKFIAPQCPTELFLGRFDGVVNSVKVAEKFVNLPQANIHWLENSAHILTLDGDIDIILDVVRKA